MSNDGVLAGEGALTRGAQIVARAKVDLDQEIKTLHTRLMSIEWGGKGATAFTGLMSRWDEEQRKLNRTLDVFEANLNSSEATYQDKDSAAEASMNKHTAGLGG